MGVIRPRLRSGVRPSAGPPFRDAHPRGHPGHLTGSCHRISLHQWEPQSGKQDHGSSGLLWPLKLQPSGEFEVFVDGKLIHSKKNGDGFVDEAKLQTIVNLLNEEFKKRVAGN
ncbi:hypothetical protein AB1E18_013395 [Capra hircus]